MLEQLGGILATAFCIAFFGSYALALFTGRRKLIAAAGWVHQLLQPLGGSSAVRWTASSAFHITATEQEAPFSRTVVTVLLKPRDLIALSIVNRLLRRNDLLMIRCELKDQPIWGVEVYRPRTLLSGLAHREIAAEQWEESELPDRDHRVAHGGGKAAQLCEVLIRELGDVRIRTWRLAVRRQFPHLLLAIDLPELTPESAAELRGLVERLVAALQPYSTVRADGADIPDTEAALS